ncbi:MAG: hypothetical protein ABIH82_03070 [Candidatus Woesearchaeota archaeon]
MAKDNLELKKFVASLTPDELVYLIYKNYFNKDYFNKNYFPIHTP